MSKPAARLGDMTVHGGVITVGCPTVIIGGQPAARIGDMHTCPMVTGMVPHVGGPVAMGSPTVLIGGMPAARVGDIAICTGPPDTIAIGCPTVFIGEAAPGVPLSPTVTPRPGEDPHVTAMRIILQGSPTGQHALEVFDRYNVNVRFATGGGSYFDSTTNTITIDSNEGLMDTSLTFVHEMNHAEYHHTVRSADVNTLNRNDYVNGMVAEETEGTVQSIQARDELAAAGYDVSGSSFPLQNEYHQDYSQAVTNMRATQPMATDAQLDAAGRAAGQNRVTQGFNNGEVVTSNTGDTYPDYYGNYWDRVHIGGP